MPLALRIHRNRTVCVMVLIWLLSVVALSSKPVRGIVALPLFIDEEPIRSEYAYVMADGHAYWERLRTASDLYHMKLVNRLLIRNEIESSRFNFVRGRSDQLVERAIDYLGLYGVPPQAIEKVPINTDSALGSMSEAKAVFLRYPTIKRIIVVTSAPHTRRSKLCFERSFGDDVVICVVAASTPSESSEITEPLWIEYFKLAFYQLFAW